VVALSPAPVDADAIVVPSGETTERSTESVARTRPVTALVTRTFAVWIAKATPERAGVTIDRPIVVGLFAPTITPS